MSTKWIDCVKEPGEIIELPHRMVRVLLAIAPYKDGPGFVCTGYIGVSGGWESPYSILGRQVTHWMPLPELPYEPILGINFQGTKTGRFPSGVAMHIELESNHAYKEMIRDLTEEARVAAGGYRLEDIEKRRAYVRKMRRALNALVDAFVPVKRRNKRV